MAFLFCRNIFFSPWLFYFAVAFLICRGFFVLPQQLLSCRDFFILPWHFCFAVAFSFCCGFFGFAVAFLFRRGFFVLPWLFCFAVAFWFCPDTYGPPYCLYCRIRKSKKSRWVFYGNLKVILGTGCLIFCAGKGASKLIRVYFKQAALNIVPSSIISKYVGSKFSVGPYKSVLSSSGAGFRCFPLTHL